MPLVRAAGTVKLVRDCCPEEVVHPDGPVDVRHGGPPRPIRSTGARLRGLRSRLTALRHEATAVRRRVCHRCQRRARSATLNRAQCWTFGGRLLARHEQQPDGSCSPQCRSPHGAVDPAVTVHRFSGSEWSARTAALPIQQGLPVQPLLQGCPLLLPRIVGLELERWDAASWSRSSLRLRTRPGRKCANRSSCRSIALTRATASTWVRTRGTLRRGGGAAAAYRQSSACRVSGFPACSEQRRASCGVPNARGSGSPVHVGVRAVRPSPSPPPITIGLPILR